MKPVLLFIFSLLVISTSGQVSDDFSDGDFTSNPAWSGSGGDFTIDQASRLQLNSPVAGQSFLSIPVNMNFQSATEWKFLIKEDFSPSSSNYSRVYLATDQADLSQPLHGYFVQFGEALSNDAIELFRQDGSTVTSICRAADGLIASAFEVRLRIVRDQNSFWKLYVDYQGGNNYQLAASGFDSIYNNAAFAGVYCLYTSGNVNKFFYDDFYFGPEILDTIPPSIDTVIANNSSLSIIFSEQVDLNSINALSNYQVDNGIGQPTSIDQDSLNPLQFNLNFTNTFQGGVNYHLTVNGVKDISNNEIISQSVEFSYTPLAAAQVNDIVFTEVYFAPAAASPLPYSEYIEIYNRSDSAIDLSGWTISDGSTDGDISSFILNPHQYALLFDENDASLFMPFPNAYPVSSFPSLNNDGDDIRLSDSRATVIDELKFSVSSYGDNNKDDDGWSIERMDVDFTCVNSDNWRASVSSFHGTPSAANSIAGNFVDADSPFIMNAYLEDSVTLKILFSETVSADANDVINYKITRQDGSELATMQSVLTNADTAVIKFSNALTHDVYTLQLSENIHDCPGNKFRTFHQIRFGYTEPPSVNDIIINELLFYCYDGSNDFVEIYNNSTKIVDLKDWIVSEGEFSDPADIKESAKISSMHKLFFPGEYLVLSSDQKKIKSYYTCSDSYAFIDVHSMPDYSSDEGSVIISDNYGNAISLFSYSDDMHFPIIKDTRGVSLERLTFSEVENNWHSAAGTAGFATPGYGNSQSVGLAMGGDGFSVNEEVFSPDGDGYCDVLAIHYRSEQTGTVLSLNAFNISGEPVRNILNQETIGSEGDVFWNGLSDTGEELPAGIYIILGTSYDLNGDDHLFKQTVFLTRNSN